MFSLAEAFRLQDKRGNRSYTDDQSRSERDGGDRGHDDHDDEEEEEFKDEEDGGYLGLPKSVGF